MNESKTPRTDLVKERWYLNTKSMTVLRKRYAQLETENAELKRQLSVAHQDYRELSDAAVRVTTERDNLIAENIRITKLRDHDFEELSELAELKRQVDSLSEELQLAQSEPAYDYGFDNGVRAVKKELAELKRQLSEAQEWIEDVKDSHRRVMEEQCPTDEQHCTCVPILRREMDELKRQIAEGELIPYHVIREWVVSRDYDLKEFAKREAGAK